MKLRVTELSSAAGGVLLSTVVITGLLGLALGAYLMLVTNENQLVVRSQVWNAALPVAEAGVEEALTHCYNNCNNNMTSSGWALSGGNYVKTQPITEGGKSPGKSASTPSY